ncbi:hypothetical protein SEPCBS57363_000395 [Sporothrix epigloea]|uniref:4a-hydroxytetrahydrobiopterin dehydratase n=1 Tax=Sporothrix epigloea TaxID=1892477 RepID=A0ABP0D602_9PEZI
MLEAGRAVAKRAVTLSSATTQGLLVRTSAVPASWRQLSSTSRVGLQQPHVHIVAKSEDDKQAVRSGVEQLLAGRWSLTANGQAIERSFKFINFTKTWDFMTSVALQCKLNNHHPEWSNVYNTTYIRWTTHHSGPGLTQKDIALAEMCDKLGRAFGAEDGMVTATKVQPQPASTGNTGSSLQDLANSAADVGDCDCSAPDARQSNSP